MLEDESYVARSATSADIERLVAFQTRVFRPSVGIWIRELLSGTHPTVSVEDFSIVEDPSSGEILSSLCLIRQIWSFDDIPLEVGQLELVGTDERYRHRGLIRTQMRWFGEKLRQHRCLLSSVRGVPWLYQRLGYQFAVPLKGGVRLHLSQLAALHESASCSVRACSLSDLPELGVLYDKLVSRLAIHLPRELSVWRYQESQSTASEHAYETLVFERAGQVVGYARLPVHTSSDAVIVKELVVDSYEDLIALFVFLRQRICTRGLTGVILELPMSHPVIPLVQTWGAEVIPPFAWQVRVIDWGGFFWAIQNVLERRLAHSLMNSYSGSLTIALTDISRAIRLVFESGKMVELVQEADSLEGQLVLTTPIATMLAMGYRCAADLEQWHLEMCIQSNVKYLINILFPKLNAYIYEAY